MSDFLTSLVARSFGTAPAIRPRVRSLFEPVRPDVAQLRDTFGNNKEEAIELGHEEVIAEETESRKSERPTRVPERRDDGATSRGVDEAPATTVPMHFPQLVREPERGVVAEKLIEKHDTKIVLGEGQRADAANQAPAIAARGHDQAPGPKEPPLSEATVAPVDAWPVEKGKPGQLIPPKVTSEMRIPHLRTHVKPERRPRDEERSVRRHEAQEATVHVTIGRIEVRATNENAHAGRPSSASPVMSLDEYLRKRAQRVGQ